MYKQKSPLLLVALGAYLCFCFSCGDDGLLGNKNNLPSADFTIEQTPCSTPPCNVQFINQSEDATTYIWEFGDGTSSSEDIDPVHPYDSIANYTVTLTALNSNGEDVATKTLFLGEENSAVIDTENPFWAYGAGRNNPESFRNHHYKFDVTENNSEVEIILESNDIDVQVWLYSPLGERITYNGGSRSHTLTETLNSGQYEVIVGTYYRGDIGNYTLDVKGNVTTPTRISSTNERIEDQVWDTQGGGYYNPSSLRNHQYTFEVTEANTAVDIILESKDSEVTLELLNSFESFDKEWGDKSEYIIYTLNEGVYSIIAGTYERDRPLSEYTLDVEGKIKNLTKIESSQSVFEEVDWETNGGGRYNPESFRNHHYIVNVSESNSTLDIILSSAQSPVALWLFGPNGGNYLKREWGDQQEFIVSDVSSGPHKIIVGTYDRNTYDATYDLDIVGKINNTSRINTQDTCISSTWFNGGGVSAPDSPDNGVFTFDVSEINSTVDIVLESPDADVCLWLFDPLGQQIDREYGDRSEFIVEAVTQGAGTYRIVAGTESAGAAGNYKISLVGQFENFQKQ